MYSDLSIPAMRGSLHTARQAAERRYALQHHLSDLYRPRAAYGSRDMLQAAHLRQAVLPASAAGAEHHFDKALVCARSRAG